jgi:hypothetical protein
MTSQLNFDPEKHEYRHGNKRVPSVSQIIRVLSSYHDVPQDKLDEAADRGRRVHAMTELIDAGETVKPDFDAIGFKESYESWLAENKIEIVLSEQRMMCFSGLWFAGTPDRLAIVNGKPYVIDIKTTAKVMPQHGVQIAAYQILAESNGHKGYKGMTLRLRDDGPPEIKKYSALEERMNRNTFISCLNIFQWKQENK